MKVDNKIGPNISSIDSAKADRVDIKSKKEGKVAPSQDEVAQASRLNLSDRAQDMKKIKDIAMSAPDVDMEKVKKFQKLIDEKKYSVDADALADKMVNEHLMLNT